ncbi:MAG: phosphoribosylglycinamide formyltransferase [Spirochaetaceae bacterium]|nr:phosphoribosylglycinamide formyltransferase [Spirochaetaceae bacterium]
MARLAVLASGNGSNFQALVQALRSRESPARHECVLLLHDKESAYAAIRARELGIRAQHVAYHRRSRQDSEAELLAAIRESDVDVVALAGFMRLLSPAVVAELSGRLVNIHPSILPAWPGTDSIRRAFEAGERIFGATVHFVDEGMDTGTVIAARSFEAAPEDTLEDIERKVHEIEHCIYPNIVLELLDQADIRRRR